MTEEQFQHAKSTFPWTQHLLTTPHKQGGIVRVMDKNGQEVPLFNMIAVVQHLTARIAAAPVAQPQPSAQAA